MQFSLTAMEYQDPFKIDVPFRGEKSTKNIYKGKDPLKARVGHIQRRRIGLLTAS